MHWQISITIATLAAFSVVLIWRAMRCSAGWRAWICYRLTMLHDCLFTQCRANNTSTIPETGPAIIVANHTSPLDPSLLWIRHFAAFRKRRLRIIGFLMAQEYYHQRGLVGWIARAMESIPLERSGRDMAPIRKALRRLERGELLGVFPEGGINRESPNERLRPGGTGVAWLALKSKAPVIPIFIHAAPRSQSMIRAFLTRSRTQLTYGSPVDLSNWCHRKPTQRDLIDVTNRIMHSLAELGGIQMTPIPNDSTGSETSHLPE